MKKALARLGLFCLGFITPVFIAACYGVSYGFTKLGRVIDAQSKGTLAGIRVSCIGQVDGSDQVLTTSYTGSDGSFSIDFSPTTDCATLRFEDVDGEENGGTFAAKDMPFDGDQDVVVEFEKA